MLSLFFTNLLCKSCHHSWDGYAHGFSRGHLVLKKETNFLFVPDDIRYGFPAGVCFDIEEIFRQLEWITIDRCPKCYSKNLSPVDYKSAQRVDVGFKEIRHTDFETNNGSWNLKANTANF